jgi:Flp pilus assembly protein TadD
MTWWNKLLGGAGDSGRVDYYDEGIDLLSEGKYHEALTSFRLALKESPGDTVVLQQIAIAYTRIGMNAEAIKTYRHVLQKEPGAAGAHYGLAYLLLRVGEEEEAKRHLHAFLKHAPSSPEAGEHIMHARATLASLAEDHGSDGGEGSASGHQAGY